MLSKPSTAVLCTIIGFTALLLLAGAPAALAVPQPRIHAASPGESLTAAVAVPGSVSRSSLEVSVQSFLPTSNPGLAGALLLVPYRFQVSMHAFSVRAWHGAI